MLNPDPRTMPIPPVEQVARLRGATLAVLAHRIEQARKGGTMCWRCTRLLAAGARCPEHPWAGPPMIDALPRPPTMAQTFSARASTPKLCAHCGGIVYRARGDSAPRCLVCSRAAA